MRAGEDSCPTRITLRGGLEVEDPLESVLRFLEMYPRSQSTPASSATSFDESDLRLANRGGARISATQAAAILDRRHVIEGVLRMIPPRASLMSASVRWMQLTRLFQGFAEIHGVGFSKMTKSLHPKRPALIPMLDSVVQQYLADSRQAHDSFAEQAVELVRRYKADADRNQVALAELRRELAGPRLRSDRGADSGHLDLVHGSHVVVTVEEIREFANTLPRSSEGFVRGRVKFRIGRIVYLSLSRDGKTMGFAFPKEWREALVASEPEKFSLPSESDMRYHWVHVRLYAIDADEMRELVEDAWAFVVPKRVVDEYASAKGP